METVLITVKLYWLGSFVHSDFRDWIFMVRTIHAGCNNAVLLGTKERTRIWKDDVTGNPEETQQISNEKIKIGGVAE